MRGLYIHIPFCLNKCPYCGFYSVVSTDNELISQYLGACIADLKSIKNKVFDTIYIGGGTPTSIPVKLLMPFIADILKIIEYNALEFTIEVNPETVSQSLINEICQLPISRISMGVQSLDDNVLSKLGRVHTADRARLAINTILSHNISLNVDLMYDIPGVEFSTIIKTAEELLSFYPAHISAYSYSPDTGYLTNSSTDDPAQMETVCNLLENKGYSRYEISNFAPIHNRSIHNMIYWQMGDYVGIGASAHSCINNSSNRIRYARQSNLAEYINNPTAYSYYDEIDPLTAFKEGVVFGLRMIDGIDLLAISNKLDKVPDEIINKIDTLVQKGILTCTETDQTKRVTATRQGLLLLDSLQSYLW